jgi:alkylhydroperoxidase/carboxymuconolactone decarboxylase family protein YurZ
MSRCRQKLNSARNSAGATKDEIADVLLAVATVAGMGRLVSAAPGVAAALEYDIEAALGDPDGH